MLKFERTRNLSLISRRMGNAGIVFVILMCMLAAQAHAQSTPTPAGTAITGGPLRVHPTNSRYFTNNAGSVIYLTGMHNWYVFQDGGESNPPPVTDYDAFLNRMLSLGHNHLRFWMWENNQWAPWSSEWSATPLPFARTGPGNALDGNPKYDLTKFNQAYFDRMRQRIIAARDKGIYISVLLFNGWSLGEMWQDTTDNPWKGHPFNKNNNINQIDGDVDGDGRGHELHYLGNTPALEVQKAYVRKVIDTVNDLDNVMYEISNESFGIEETTPWQYEIIRYIKSYEAGKPRRHLVGMSAPEWTKPNDVLLKSPADWIAPSKEGGYQDNPPAAQGGKPIIADSDHIFGVGGDETWIWKIFTRGMNPIYMDDMGNEDWKQRARVAMGKTRGYAQRMNLAGATPRGDLTSTGYMLANPGREYLAFNPNGGAFTINLAGANQRYVLEWHNAATGETMRGESVSGGRTITLNPPFSGPVAAFLTTSTPAIFNQRVFLPAIYALAHSFVIS